MTIQDENFEELSEEKQKENLAEREKTQADRTSNPHLEKLAEAGTRSVQLADGVVMDASPDMIRAWQSFAELKAQNKITTENRRDAFNLEKRIMGETILPIGLQIQHKGRMARIIGLSRVDVISLGIFNHPLYHVEYQSSPGMYPEQYDERNCAHVYAREFHNYGLQGAIDGSTNAA